MGASAGDHRSGSKREVTETVLADGMFEGPAATALPRQSRLMCGALSNCSSVADETRVRDDMHVSRSKSPFRHSFISPSPVLLIRSLVFIAYPCIH